MLEMQAAIGRIQLRRMLDWTAKRTVNAQFIWAACRQHAAVRVPAFGCNTRACDTACASRSGCDPQVWRPDARLGDNSYGSHVCQSRR